MYREDYTRGGLKMLPCEDPTGQRTFRQTVAFAAILIPVSLLPVWFHLSGTPYAIGAVALGLWMLAACVRFARTGGMMEARKVLRASVIYLPLLLALIVIDFSLG